MRGGRQGIKINHQKIMNRNGISKTLYLHNWIDVEMTNWKISKLFFEKILNISCIYLFFRWKRRFGNRAENDTSPSDETLPEVEDNIPLGRPYLLNNKIYPGVQQQQQESLKDKVRLFGLWGHWHFSVNSTFYYQSRNLLYSKIYLQIISYDKKCFPRLRLYAKKKFNYRRSSASCCAPSSPCWPRWPRYWGCGRQESSPSPPPGSSPAPGTGSTSQRSASISSPYLWSGARLTCPVGLYRPVYLGESGTIFIISSYSSPTP